MKKMRIKYLAFFAILLLSFKVAKSQTLPLANQDDVQSWNDVQLTMPLSKKVDLVTQVTARLGKNISRFNDGRFQFGFAYKPNKAWTIQPFYWFIKARDSRGRLRREDRFNLRIGYKFPIKSFGLSHRSWFEYRKRTTGNSWRYRPSLTFEKELLKKFKSKLYITEEIFYDSTLDKFSRNRFTIGINRALTKQLSVDLFYMKQNDGFSRPGDLNVIGVTWKIKF
jgi:Protein of unknown function (DUF2490)